VARRLILAALGLMAATAAQTARADWQVHRDGTQALVERAEQALRENPDDERLARRLVQVAGRRGAAALRARFEARARKATTSGPVAAYAELLLALGDAEAAAAAFGDALRLAPEAPALLAGRARALATASSSEAPAAFDEAIAHETRPAPRRRLIEEALGLSLGTAGTTGADLARAVTLRRELVRLAPGDDRAAERLAEALAQAGKPAEAAAVLERLLSSGHPLAKLPLEVRAARLRLADHDPADAARADARLRRLLDQIPPGAAESRRSVWTCLRDLARARGTLGELAGELAKAPGLVEWDLLGQIRDELGDLEGARTATEKARALAPRDAGLGRRLLEILDRLGRDDEALAAAAELAREAPSDVGFAVGLGDRQLRRGDRAGAGATFDRALARFSREPSALESLAEAAGRWGDEKRALAAWTRLARIDPGSEVAIVGLGEAQFQAGKRDDARRTWAKLRGRPGSAADGHRRLGQLLYDHDLVDDALAEARKAEAAAPSTAGPHRLLAQIAERERRLDDAVSEWRRILTLARDPRGEDAGLRREARMRLLALLARQGRGKLEAEVHRLAEAARQHPDDVDAAVFLAEAQQRMGDAMGAIATLRAIAARGSGAPDGRWKEAAVDAELALARLLRQTGQLDEAATRLGELARLSPDRARDAELQIAELALGRYDLAGALSHAAAAEKGADAGQLARIAELRERAGDDQGAVATYRAAIARGGPPKAALALARLLERQEDAAGAASVLEDLLRAARDDAAISDAVRLALGVEESLGRLPALALALIPDTTDDRETAARRRALVEVLDRALPALARDPAGDATRSGLGRTALRPLLDLVVVGDVPDRRAIELLGLLGNADAVPALARVAARGADKTHGTAALAASEARQAALVALGRLADPRGFAPLAEAATNGAVVARVAAVWGLGRITDERIRPILWRAVEDPRPDIQALACLGLGRHADDRAVRFLARIAGDGIRPIEVRRAAVLALGRAGGREAVTTLLDLLQSGDDVLARTTAVALAWTRDPRALSALLGRAILGDGAASDTAEPTLDALGVWLTGGAPPDEARAINGNELAVPEILAALATPPPPGDLAPLLRAKSGEIDALLADALGRGGAARRAALAALDARPDGPGLGALVTAGPLPPETQAALREIAWPLSDGIAAALDDPDGRTRAAALRLLAKLDDERLTPARLGEAIANGEPVLAEAAVAAARIVVRAHPPLAAQIAAAIGPLAVEEGGSAAGSWSSRLAAVELLAVLGPAGLPPLDRASGDRNPLVRSAALEALGRARGAPPGG
jgi:tetratricopeptide (TPR) repeat protein